MRGETGTLDRRIEATPAGLRSVRTLLYGLAVLDFTAMVLLLGVYVLDREAFTAWVTEPGPFQGLARQKGEGWAAGYAVIATSAVHVLLTGLFLWFARAVRAGKRSTRIRLTILMIVSAAVNLFAARSPLGGSVQQLVMGASVLLKLAVLVQVWRPGPVSAHFADQRPAES